MTEQHSDTGPSLALLYSRWHKDVLNKDRRNEFLEAFRTDFLDKRRDRNYVSPLTISESLALDLLAELTRLFVLSTRSGVFDIRRFVDMFLWDNNLLVLEVLDRLLDTTPELSINAPKSAGFIAFTIESLLQLLAAESDSETSIKDQNPILCGDPVALSTKALTQLPLFEEFEELIAMFKVPSQEEHLPEPGKLSVPQVVATRLLRIENALLREPRTFKGLLSHGEYIKPLFSSLQILALHPAILGCGSSALFCVFQTLLLRSSEQVSSIVMLVQRGALESIFQYIKIVEMRPGGPSRAEMDLARSLFSSVVVALRRSSRMTRALADSFRAFCSSDAVVRLFTIPDSRIDTPSFYLLFAALCHLPIVYPAPLQDASSNECLAPKIGLVNAECLRIVLELFTQVNDPQLKTAFLRLALAVLRIHIRLAANSTSANKDDKDESMIVSAATPPLVQFDSLTPDNQITVLEAFDKINLKALPLASLRTYLCLMRDTKFSTILRVGKHLMSALDAGTADKDQLLDAGVYSVISQYLVSHEELVRSLPPSEDEDMNATKELAQELFPEETNGGYEDSKEFIVFIISKFMLRLLQKVITDYPRGQTELKENNQVMKLLYNLIHDSRLRPDVLPILEVMARTFCSEGDILISHICATFQGYVAQDRPQRETNEEMLEKWCDVLSMLCRVIESSQEAAVSFRATSGFSWCVSVLNKFHIFIFPPLSVTPEPCPESPKGPRNRSCLTKKTISRFVFTVMAVMRAGLKGCLQNIVFFRNELTFDALVSSMKSCLRTIASVFPDEVNNSILPAMCATLFYISIRGEWAEYTELYKPETKCEHPKRQSSDSLTIVIPELISATVSEIIPFAVHANPPLAEKLCESILFLLKSSPQNKMVLASDKFDMQGSILKLFRDDILSFSENDDKSYLIYERLRQILIILCSFNTQPHHLRAILKHFSRKDYPPNVLGVLETVASERLRLYLNMPWSSVLLDADPELPASVLGLSSNWLQAQFEWPLRSFALSFWFSFEPRAHAVLTAHSKPGDSSPELGYHTLFSILPQSKASSLVVRISDIGNMSFSMGFASATEPKESKEAKITKADSKLYGVDNFYESTATFGKYVFEESVWHHVVLSYMQVPESRPSGFFSSSSSANSLANVKLFVDGELQDTQRVVLPGALQSRIRINVGSCMAESSPKKKPCIVHMGNAYFFGSHLGLSEAQRLYEMGPSVATDSLSTVAKSFRSGCKLCANISSKSREFSEISKRIFSVSSKGPTQIPIAIKCITLVFRQAHCLFIFGFITFFC